jgi:hypothetical protein
MHIENFSPNSGLITEIFSGLYANKIFIHNHLYHHSCQQMNLQSVQKPVYLLPLKFSIIFIDLSVFRVVCVCVRDKFLLGM